MIINNGKQIELKFGTGDICVTGGRCEDFGVVTFSDRTPREIGSRGDIIAGQVYDLNKDFPIIMTFTKKESIDVVIGALEQAKNDMD